MELNDWVVGRQVLVMSELREEMGAFNEKEATCLEKQSGVGRLGQKLQLWR